MKQTLNEALQAKYTDIIYCDKCFHRKEDGYCPIIKAHTPDTEFCKDGKPREDVRESED